MKKNTFCSRFDNMIEISVVKCIDFKNNKISIYSKRLNNENIR